MIKFYIPDGHLEPKTLELFKKAGFHVESTERAYSPGIDDPDVVLKRLRPQDFPYLLSMGKGDVGIVGVDILKEFQLEDPPAGARLVELLDLGLHVARLVVALSEQAYPGVTSLEEFRDKVMKKSGRTTPLVIATEYPALAKQHLSEWGIEGTIRQPAGKTEAWVVPPLPEADLIVETVETGKTLLANRCLIIGEVLKSSARLVANAHSLEDPDKSKKIHEIVDLFKGALRAHGMVNVYMDVVNPADLDSVLEALSEYVKHPTISSLKGGGYDIFVVIHERNLKYILPRVRKCGATSIVISDTRMVLE